MNAVRSLAAVILLAGLCASPVAKTRWSALQMIPSADMLAGGRFVADADLYWLLDPFEIGSPVSAQILHAGISEWVNVSIGYADGFTAGFKVNLVREVEESHVPSISIGAQNLFMSREALYVGADSVYPKNDLYFVMAKSSEWAKLRVQAGVMSSIDYEKGSDQFSPFAGIEKYFGAGLYMTAELERRAGEWIFSIFAVYRLVKDRLELSVGVVDAPGVGSKPVDPQVVNPGLRAGLKVYLGSGHHTFDGLTGVEDRIDRHRDTIMKLSKRLDSLRVETQWNSERIHALVNFPDDAQKEGRTRVMSDIEKLRALYDQEPFDPELVKNTLESFAARRDRVLPHLRVIIIDPETPRRVRALAVSLAGELRDTASANVLMSMLTRFEEPALKIEAIVALGKMGETRCKPMLKPLMSDPDSGVAFAAAEVYRALFGDEDKPVLPARDDLSPDTMPERRLNK